MPALVAAVASFFTVTITVAPAYAAFATALAGAWNYAVASFLLGKISQALSGKPKRAGPAPQTITVKGTLEPRRIIYGEVRTAGVIAWFGTTGNENEFLWFVIALAGHQCDAITDVWLDSEHIPNDYINPTTGMVSAGRFSSKVRIWKKLGLSNETALPELVEASSEITGDHIGFGVAKLIICMERDANVFPQGAPQEFFALVRGKRVYDPRKDSTNGGSGSHRLANATTWEWTDNPALCVADYLHGGSIYYDTAAPLRVLGMDVPTNRVNWTYVAASANVCDEQVLVPGGSQKRYAIGAVLSCGSVHDENVDTILATMLGQRIFTAGAYRIYAGAYDTPTLSITDDDLTADGYTLQGATNDNDLYNEVVGTYYDPERDWQPMPCAVRTEASYIAEDGGRKLRSIDLSGITNEYRAQRICEVVKKQTRNQAVVTLNMKLSAAKVAPWETFSLTLREQGWINKVVRAQSIEIDLAARRIRVTAKEESLGAYLDPAVLDYAAPGAAAPTSTVERPSPPRNLQANGIQDGILFTFSPSLFFPPGARYELYEHTSPSGFGAATRVADGLSATPLFLQKSDTTERYYWIIAKSFEGQSSDRHPVGNGIAGRADAVSAAYSVSVTPGSVLAENSTASITTPAATVSAKAGAPPYTYVWTWASGGSGITITSPTSASTTFSATGLSIDQTRSGQAQCTVTDNGSVTRTITVSVTIRRVSTQLAATASPSSISVLTNDAAVLTQEAVVTATRGTPGYTYAWTWISGGSGISISSPTSATTRFGATPLPGGFVSGVARCTVTDSASASVTVDVSVQIQRTDF